MAGNATKMTATDHKAAPMRGRERGEAEPPAIRVSRLVKHYAAAAKGKSVVEAVRGIDLEVKRGEIFGLIGPDGAGKTSSFQILAGVMEPTSGVAEVFGRPAREARSQTGYLTQAFSLYPDLTVSENIRYIGELRRVAPHEIEQRGHRYLQMFDMDRFQNRLAGKLSGGMKQKLALACALVPEPHVLLLDEPTTGVDPVSRREFWDTLAHLAASGLTILVATPYLDEAERCHRVALMHQGVIQQAGTPAELRSSMGARRLELRVGNLAAAEQVLSQSGEAQEDILDVQRFGDRLDVLVRDAAKAQPVLENRLKAAQLAISDVQEDEPTLENVFVANLRSLGHATHEQPFPGRHAHQDLRGQVAIGAKDLTRMFVDFKAVENVNLEVRYG